MTNEESPNANNQDSDGKDKPSLSGDELLLKLKQLREDVNGVLGYLHSASIKDKKTLLQEEEARKERRARDEAVARKLDKWLRQRHNEQDGQSMPSD